MKKLFACMMCVAAVALVSVASGGDKKAPKVDGTWIATGGNSEGKKIPAEIIEKINLMVILKDGKYSVNAEGKEVESGSYKVDFAKKPVSLDITVAKGKDEGKTQLGILKLEGDDNMTVAIANPGKDRPKDFDGGADIEVTILKRKK